MKYSCILIIFSDAGYLMYECAFCCTGGQPGEHAKAILCRVPVKATKLNADDTTSGFNGKSIVQ